MEDTLSFNGRVDSRGIMQFGTDEALHFEWETAPEKLGFETTKQGREIFRNIDRCTIHYPGHKHILCKDFGPEPHDQLMLKQFLDLHPKARAAYVNFKESNNNQWQGTPIDEWPAISVAERQELKYLKLFTIEQVAAASDMTVQAMGMSGLSYRAKAQAFLETAKETAAAQKYAVENERLSKDIEMLKNQIAQLANKNENDVVAKSKSKKANELEVKINQTKSE